MNSLKIGISIIISSLILAFGLTNIITPERSVSVRGLSEKEVDADLAIWNMAFSTGDNNLSSLQQSVILKTQTVKKYLKDHGLDENDFTVQPAAITDNSLNSYMDQSKLRYTFIARQTILIRSSKIHYKIRLAFQG